MERACRYEPLSKQPLVLVLCQVRFSRIRSIETYLPAIQEVFRRRDFPLESSGKIQQVSISPGGGVQVQQQDRWEYRTKDEAWSILLLEDSVTLQTTAYERFEGFAERMALAVRTVLEKTEHDQFGQLLRIGLRYVDLVQPQEGEDFRKYLRNGLHGVSDSVFEPSSHRIQVESVGSTDVGGVPGRMIIRVLQNDQGFDLPPDLIGGAPKHDSRSKEGELVTLVDMDHSLEGKFEPQVDWVIEKTYQLHDQIIEAFHSHVVTPEAVEVWR